MGAGAPGRAGPHGRRPQETSDEKGVIMVRTIEYRSFGGPEVLEMVEVPESAPGPGRVRIAVRAAGSLDRRASCRERV